MKLTFVVFVFVCVCFKAACLGAFVLGMGEGCTDTVVLELADAGIGDGDTVRI